METEASAGEAVKMKAAAAGGAEGHCGVGWHTGGVGPGLGWVVNVRRTCCFCGKTCA